MAAAVKDSAYGLLATPPEGLQTHSGLWAQQLVAGFTQEVNLVSQSKHPT